MTSSPIETNSERASVCAAKMRDLYEQYGYGLSHLPVDTRSLILQNLAIAVHSNNLISDHIYLLSSEVELNRLLCLIDGWNKEYRLLLIENIAFMLRVDAEQTEPDLTEIPF